MDLKILLIIIFASFLYFFKIDIIPNGVYSDEATVGYNAYSILKTGRDEYGQKFPLAFRFFGAYTPPLFVYISIPFIKLLGLDVSSLRIISGLSTILGIYLIYFYSEKLNLFNSKASRYLASFTFAITPWVVFNARLGYEVTLGYIVFSLGLFLVWDELIKNKLSLAGLLILSLSTYIGHTQRYLFPVFLLFFSLLFYSKLNTKNNRKLLLKTVFFLLLSQIPNIILLTTPAFWVKNNVYVNSNISQLFNDFSSQLLTYLSPKYIFGISPDINLQHTSPYLPLFYSWLIIPFFIGLFQLYFLRKTLNGKYLWLIFLISPIPGSLSGHFISVQRVLSMIIPMILIITLGFDFLINRISKPFVIIGFSFLTFFSLLLLWRSYFIFLPKERSVWWNYGYKELCQEIKNNPTKKYIIDNTRDGSVYMNLLFHLKFSPVQLQNNFLGYKTIYYNNPPFNPNYNFANIEIRPIYWEKDLYMDQILVGDLLMTSDSQAKSHSLNKVIDIKDLTGKTIIIGYETNPGAKYNSKNSKL